MDLDSFVAGSQEFEIEHDMFVDRLKYLPGNTIEGNQTLMVRALVGSNSSANVVTHIHVMGSEKAPADMDDSGFLSTGLIVGGLSFLLFISLAAAAVLFMQLQNLRGTDLLYTFEEAPIEATLEDG
jgi:hypothetical protein